MERWRERPHAAEIYRIKGDLLMALEPPNFDAAVQAYQQVLSVSLAQQAKSWELRVATSLARLWQSRNRTREAHELLFPVYDWFTEGFDTADLMDAKALLEALK